MEYKETITKEQLNCHLNDIRGIKISHVWLGYANVLFLECGKLKQVSIKDKKRNNPKGDVTFMLQCDWRIETTRSIFCGRNSHEKKLDGKIKKLVGLKIKDVTLINRIPELLIHLENKWILQTFTSWDTQPQWTILFDNLHKIAVHPEWKKEDVSVCLGFGEGHYRRSFCFDDETLRNKQFLNDYCGQE